MSLPSAPKVRGAGFEPRLFAHIAPHTDSNFFTGFSGDLSEGGVFVTTYEPLAVGQTVCLELCLGGYFVTLSGRVAWRREPLHGELEPAPGVGVWLAPPDEPVRGLIQQFMAHREPTFVDTEELREAI